MKRQDITPTINVDPYTSPVKLAIENPLFGAKRAAQSGEPLSGVGRSTPFK